MFRTNCVPVYVAAAGAVVVGVVVVNNALCRIRGHGRARRRLGTLCSVWSFVRERVFFCAEAARARTRTNVVFVS